jgi:hypothetical protein
MFNISVSYYGNVPGWTDKYAVFREVMAKKEIAFKESRVPYWIDFGFRDTTLDKDKNGLEKYFDNCGDFCHGMWGGREYYCEHAHMAAKAFYPEINEEGEYLDFHDDTLTKERIVKWNLGIFDKGYLEMCNHCNGWGCNNRKQIPVAEQIE